MTIVAFDSRQAGAPPVLRHAVPLWAWWLMALLAATGLALFAKGPGRAFEFIDSDDALRFIHVRELLTGAPWFEIATTKLGGTQGLVSHWSRLIDGPIAMILGILGAFFSQTDARNAVVTIWPMLMLAAVLWAIARATDAVAGRAASLFALVLAATSLLTYYQFAPGRIDHHNVMIATTVAATLVLWAWPHDERMWRCSGALCAVALAIGYEALAPVALIAVLAAGWGLLDATKAGRATGFVTALVATLAIVFVATVSPARWLTNACDTLSLNMVVLGACAGAGYVVAMRNAARWAWPLRLGVMTAATGCGLALFGWLEPACLAGPMGQVPPELGPVWMGQVDEAQSLLAAFLKGEVAGSAAPIMIFTTGTVSAILAFARSSRLADRFMLAAVIGFVVLALWQMKYLAYASFVLVPGIAVLIARLPALGGIGAPVARVLAILLLNQFMLFALAVPLASRFAPAAAKPAPDASAGIGSPQMQCTAADDLRAFSALPAGLVVTHNDIGAHLAAVTGLRALAGPYHRIPAAILTNHAILSAAEFDTARRLLASTGAAYVLTCTPMDSAQIARPGWEASFLARLAAGDAPAWLTPVPHMAPTKFRMWRVLSDRLPSR
jgi:hypothetical protein